MYNKSIKKSETIKELYNKGVLLNDIAELTSSSTITVKKVLLALGIDYTKSKQEDYQKRLAQVVELYNQGKSQLFMEKELKLTRKTIRELLSKSGVKYRDKSEQKFIDWGTELDETVFDKLTPEALYWIGLLHADGHIEKKEYAICLTLHNDDYQHLETFKEFLKSNRKITSDHGNCSRVRINSKKIWNRLKGLGFTHNKSSIGKPHELVKWSRDFWRGEIDGDGGVYDYKYHQMTLCGTLETIFDFIIFCSKEAGIKEKYPSHSNKEGYNKNKLFQVAYYSEDCRKVLDLLYKDSTVYLDRKYQKYLEIVSEVPELSN